ncbi:hypothetical protein [uncultured Arcobacter sp.]|uniref:hypothetical protein n=1 Tax=uncultured Arcobacter sp. TaxID=165434 RepID=UPI00260E42C3|nr:hypothetical protein [uncultured Arcobacter sp.]
MANIYPADFDGVKDKLKEFLQSQDEYKDYNFDASGLSVIIDTLAFNTQYQLFYLNMVLNEMFMATATQEKSVYNLSNMLNYLPKRKKSANITVSVTNTNIVNDVIIPKYSSFAMGSITLVNVDNFTIPANSTVDIILREGEWTVQQYTSDGTDYQRFLLADREYIDNDYLFVYKYPYDSETDTVTESTTPLTLLNGNSVDPNNENYYIEYLEYMYVKFDNGTICTELVENDVVTVKYLKTNGSLYNGNSATITLSSAFTGSTDLTFDVDSNVLIDGVDEEDIESIKISAPQFYVTNNRAVTEDDYLAVLKRYSNYESYANIIAWGGEKEFVDIDSNIVPEADGTENIGNVYFTAIKNDNETHPTSLEIDDIFSFVDGYKVVTLNNNFKYTNILYITPSIDIKLSDNFDVTLADIKADIVDNYLANLIGYRKTFNKSNLTRYIDDLNKIDYSDVSYTTSVKYYNNQDVLRLWNQITIGSISADVSGNALTDSDNGDGTGDLNLVGTGQVGTIYYNTGEMFFTHDFGVDIDISFTFTNQVSFSLFRETFLDFNDFSLNLIV